MENGQNFLQKVRGMFFNKHSLFLSSVILLCSLGLYFSFVNNKLKEATDFSTSDAEKLTVEQGSTDSPNAVLGTGYQQYPQIYISGGEQGYSSGGMIALSSIDEPAVVIGGYDISGDADIDMYEANESSLLEYLTHDKDGKQTKSKPDISKFRFVKNIKHNINTSSYQGSKVPLPLGETGIWYLKVKMGKINADAYILRSNIGVVTKEGDDKLIFWGQNFKTKRSISDGTVKLLNLTDAQKELQMVSFNAQGLAESNLLAETDIALVSQNEDRAIIPLNLKYLNTSYNYKQFQPKSRLTRYFIFTDRPLYKPGDTVNFKTVLRDDDDARFTIPGGEATVRLYNGYYYEGSTSQPVFEKKYPVSSDGTISGQYQIPVNGSIGNYNLYVTLPSQKSRDNIWDYEYSTNSIGFDVQFYKKPEFFIDVTVPKTEAVAGDKASFKITGNYFSGQPMLGQNVKYKVNASDFYEYQYFDDFQNYERNLDNGYSYGYSYDVKEVGSGTATLDANGEAEISVDTKMSFNSGKTQIFTIEATIEDGSLEPSFARRNLLVYAGEYGIYREDYSYGSKINTPLSLPMVLKSYKNNFSVSGINLNAKIKRENWVSKIDPSQKYPVYNKEEENLPDISAKTDSQGKALFTFTPLKVGSYMITVEGKDAGGNIISKIFYAYVSADGEPYYTQYGNNELTIAADKQKYSPTDTARFNIFSQVPDRDVFLSLERGRVNRFEIVHLKGKTGFVEVPLVNTDIPNIFASVSSFSSSTLDSNQTDITLSSDTKKLVVNVTPNSKTFGPGEEVSVNVSTTDTEGNPVSADLALWTVDKAIFELSDNKLGDIFDTFWHNRQNSTQTAHSLEGILVRQAEGGGCFAQGTKVLMAEGGLKNIEEVKAGDYVLTRSEKATKLVKAKVLNTHSTEVGGYLIFNGSLKVTANHILWINNKWMEAGSAQIGDELTDIDGNQIKISSIEWQRGKFNVYNLEVEKYHTYFAGGVWVHNQKGMERNAFKDTAYWNPSLHTDESGHAKITFKLPDNLTTWTIAAVGSTTDTKVGQTTSEIVVSKDVIVRPILPNIMRIGDEIVLSAIVQNFTDSDKTFDVDLKFASGEVEEALKPDVLIKSKGRQQFYWKTKVTKENDKSKLVFSAKVKNDPKLADILTQEIPVRAFGFEEKTAQLGEGAKNFDIRLSSDSAPDKSSVSLSLSPTILGTLPTAMKYLIDYPYGCVEQTTSRFVPAVIAKANQGLFAEALKDKDIDEIIEKGISRLKSLQQGDGGWGWWGAGNSDPYVSAYVAEYLVLAQKSGIKVDQDMLDGAKRFLEQESFYSNNGEQKYYTKEEAIAKIYGLAVMGVKSNYAKQSNDLNNLSADFLSLAVMSNYLNGNTNPQTNGLSKLISMAQTQGDSVFWKEGQKLNFGSVNASTALAIRAILLAGGERDLALKGMRYLTRSRKSDYWSNTYATAQVIRGIVEFSKTGDELTPNYNYSVSLDGKNITQGVVNDSKQFIKDILVPVNTIKKDGSKLSISMTGNGQLYSTLLLNEFHTDRNALGQDNGLSVKREYVNEKGSEYSLGVGDSAIVKITVGGLKEQENYGVINDQLPSGMVPINENFLNTQYGQDRSLYYTSYDISDREITENGMVLSVYQIAPGERTYTYRARVINEGSFIVPPTTASLMYAPEINGRSEAQILVIDKESKFTPKQALEKTLTSPTVKYVFIGVGILIVLTGIGIFIAWKKRQPPALPVQKP